MIFPETWVCSAGGAFSEKLNEDDCLCVDDLAGRNHRGGLLQSCLYYLDILALLWQSASLGYFVRGVLLISLHQGVGRFSQSHRVAPDADSKIPGYENMSFEQRRFAQDQKAEAARRGR